MGTNAPRPAGALCIEEIKKQFEAGDIIEDLVIGAECTRAKPFGDPYLEGMKRISKKPEECIVFEDSRSGIAAGKAAGVAEIAGIDQCRLSLAQLSRNFTCVYALSGLAQKSFIRLLSFPLGQGCKKFESVSKFDFRYILGSQ